MSEEKKKNVGGQELKPQAAPAGKTPTQKPAQKPQQKPIGKPAGKKPEPPPATGAARVLRVLYIVLTVISALIVLGYIFWKIFAAPPSVDNNPGRPSASRPPLVITTRDPITGEEIEVEIPALSGDRKKEFYTFLMVGQSQDEGGKLTDTMMMAAYDVPNQKLSIMSLPRDTYVKYNGSTILLNSVYNYAGGYRDDEKGIQGLKKAVQELTGVYPDFHAVIQWEALGELVDAIGGVEFEVPFKMYYNDKSQHFKIDLQAGKQLLDGNGAMGLVRWRQNSVGDSGVIDYSYGYREGDIGRIKTQQAFLKEVIKKCLQPGVILDNWTEYLDIFQRNVITNLTPGEMAYFAQSAVGGLKIDDVAFATLPYAEAGNGHLVPSGRQIVATVNAGFNPYEEDIHVGELKLATLDDVPRSTPDPEETVDPDATPDPDESPDPDATPGPEESGEPGQTGEGDPLLPPGVLVRPSPKPSGSPRPGESGRPDASAQPSGSPRPTESGRPWESAQPSGSPRPAESGNPGGAIHRPGEEPKQSEKPDASPKPTAPNESNEPTAKPVESGAPAPSKAPEAPSEPTPWPTQYAIPGGPSPEEPLLPPGV